MEQLAAGVYLTRSPSSPDTDLMVDSPIEMPAWSPRVEGDAVRATFPGTTVLYEGDAYEVLHRFAPGHDRPRWRYTLRRWDDRYPQRARVALTAAGCTADVELARAGLLHRLSSLVTRTLMPLSGALPADLQRRLEESQGFPAARATIVSAIAGLNLAVLALALAEGLGDVIAIMIGWLGAESIVRLAFGLTARRPMGSLYGLALTPIIWPRLRPDGSVWQRPPSTDETAGMRSLLDGFDPGYFTEALWGLLPAIDQRELAVRYGFAARRATARGRVVAGGFGLLLLACAGLYAKTVRLSLLPAALASFGLWLMVESAARRRAPPPNGSVLGLALRPIAGSVIDLGRATGASSQANT